MIFMEECDFQKRRFLKTAAAAGFVGGVAAISPAAFADGERAPTVRRTSVFNVRNYGAKGDGETSDTAAIQKALDAAGKIHGAVYFPAGEYVCSKLRLPRNTMMFAEPQWGYRGAAGAVLKLESPDADCVIDITGAFGGRVCGLFLKGLGRNNEKKSHGIYLNNANGYSKQEDSCVIEDCHITGFSGDAVYLKRVWLFIVRRNIFIGNGGAGIRVQGWDGFVSDNQLSANGQGGFVGDSVTSTVMFTANRVEWNGAHGLDLPAGDAWNITGNSFDRNWGAAVKLRNISDSTVTGNVFRRNGKDASKLGDEYSCQAYLENCLGITVSANSAATGIDDRGKGERTPKYGFVTKNLRYCAITSNAMFKGFTEKFFNELAPNTECAIRDNVGTVAGK